ncbi:MAG: phosphodiester glycosidase family protein [Anaerolineae bacterium]|nr:phosphodiester glycosidase family protein [Anaerolineae bacterium]
MSHDNKIARTSTSLLPIVAVIVLVGVLVLGVTFLFPASTTSEAAPIQPPIDVVERTQNDPQATPPPASPIIAVPLPTNTPKATATYPPTATSIARQTLSPTATSTPTVSPTPTYDLANCTVLGCNVGTVPPTVQYAERLLLLDHLPQRTDCPDCPPNEEMSESEINQLLSADADTVAQLAEIARSQQPYEIAPGIVYIVFDNAHHVVVDLKASGFTLRNIIPPVPDLETQADIRITPSFCMRPDSLVITDADYHGLVGSNKTEEGRELFFHLGRAALFLRRTNFNENRYNIDVMTQYKDFQKAIVSWGSGPIFIFNGRYDFNPKQEWFEADALEHFAESTNPKMTVAISRDRKYLFLSVSTGLTLEEHAQNLLSLAERWGIVISRAMRFDGNESIFLGIRMGDHMVPVVDIKEPLIVNCFAIERN